MILGENTSVIGIDFDQRGTGFPRIFNVTVDMGAVEVQSIAASGGGGGGANWDGVGVNSLTSVLLQDQSGLDCIGLIMIFSGALACCFEREA